MSSLCAIVEVVRAGLQCEIAKTASGADFALLSYLAVGDVKWHSRQLYVVRRSYFGMILSVTYRTIFTLDNVSALENVSVFWNVFENVS